MSNPDLDEKEREKEDKVKQLTRVVCICKGIKLGQVLPALPHSETVSDVNRKCGSGSGGCRGQRCGPRIRILLKKYAESQK